MEVAAAAAAVGIAAAVAAVAKDQMTTPKEKQVMVRS
jgi:hypothetical protein